MQITFSLSDNQYAANDRSGLMVGLPISAQFDAGLLTTNQEDGCGWIRRDSPGRSILKPFSLDRCVFSGRVDQFDTWQSQGTTVCQVLVDCGVPLRMDLIDPDLDSGEITTPYNLTQGNWIMGTAPLAGLLALEPGTLLWKPTSGTIVDIQRLYLNPVSPAFGTLRWFHGLPPQSFAPDLVFVTMEISGQVRS
ncbi:MAG: hypothetical protein U9R25_04390 [Chloroflexota bacterium]|nr:hypothetical protein [Chloroflexota bacterium]